MISFLLSNHWIYTKKDFCVRLKLLKILFFKFIISVIFTTLTATGFVGVFKRELYTGVTSNMFPHVTHYQGRSAVKMGIIYFILFGVIEFFLLMWLWQEPITNIKKMSISLVIIFLAFVLTLLTQEYCRKTWLKSSLTEYEEKS